MYDVIDICRYMIVYCNRKNYAISNLKLQKLLYFIQAIFLCEEKGRVLMMKLRHGNLDQLYLELIMNIGIVEE